MKFRYRKYPVPPSEAHPSLRWYLRPVIPTEIIHKTNKLKTFAVIDSGADWCIFQGAIGQEIGIDVTSGKQQKLIGLAQKPVLAYFHDIELNIGGWKLPCYAGFSFALDKLPFGILGQDGFFSQYIDSYV